MLHQLLHTPQGSDPGAIDSLLAVHDVRGGIEGHIVALAQHHHFAPFPRTADGQRPGGRIAGAVRSALAAIAACHFQDLVLTLFGIR